MRRDTRAVGLLVGMLLVLVGAPSSAGPRNAAPPLVRGEMVVWSGGKTRAEAERQLEGLKPYLKALEPVLKFQPAVVESARVEGLKPGFFIVALGVCPKQQVEESLATFQAIYPDVYTRSVKYQPTDELPALECPELAVAATNDADQPVHWELEKAVRLKQGKHQLIGLAFTYRWEEAGDFARAYHDLRAVHLLVEAKKRRLVDSELYDGPSDATTLRSFESEGKRLVSTVEYGDPVCEPMGDSFQGWRVQVKASIAKSAIKLAETEPELIAEGSCGYAEEKRMVGGEEQHSEEYWLMGAGAQEEPPDEAYAEVQD